MKKEMSYLNSYKFKNYNPANNRLPNKFPILTDLNSFSSFSTNIKNKTKSTNELTYSKNINLNNKSSSMTKNSKLSQYKNNKLYYVFQKPKEKNKNKYIWPKITQPKLPFSKREKIPEEERKKLIREQKPNRKYHDFNMIKWLRNRYSDSLIEKSVFSMLPDNGKPVVPDDESEEDKKHRLLKEFLDSLYKRVPEREKNVNINPKYFFDQKTFQKILKFKEIFLEFDEDQSRKMEIDEMVEMFNQNHIEATLEDLRNLFFKEKKVKKEDIMKLYLDFYQFMNFALTKDQDFREFMREIKAKRKKNEKNTGIGDKSKNKEEDEDDNGYLPMNFNLMFDYFLMKGKERASIDEIEKGMNEMDKIINSNKNNGNENDDNNSEEKGKLKFEKRSSNADLLKINEKNNEDINKINKDYDDQLKNLNFVNLIENFTTLFHITDSQSNGISDSFLELVQSHQESSGVKSLKLKNDNNIQTSIFNEKESKINEPKNKNQKKNLSASKILNAETFEKLVKYDINKKLIKNLNMNNYNKYHDIHLALTETRKEVNNFIKTQKLKEIKLKGSTNNLHINDSSLIDINSNQKNNYAFNQKMKEKSLKPLFTYDKTKNYITKNFSNSVKINFSKNSQDINNYNNQNIKSNRKSEISSIYSYRSFDNKKNINLNKMDFVPPELLKEKKRRRYFRFFI